VPAVDNWVPQGLPISDPRLRDRIIELHARVAALTPEVATADFGPPRDIDDALSRIDGLTEVVLALPGKVPERAELVADLREHRAVRRYDALAGIREALAQLRGITSAQDMLERTPAAICECLGFDRAIISRVEDSLWSPVQFHVTGDPEWAAALKVASAEPQPLDHMILESEMARRRAPMLVADVQSSQHVHQPIASVSDSRSYVAAPIMPEGHVIGFLHADYYLSRRHVDEFDRDLLWAFAEGFGYLFMKVVLGVRLRAQADQVRAMSASLEAVIDEIRDSEVRIADEAHPAAFNGPRRMSAPSATDHRLRSLLTARELEVLALMAAGETNAAIGARLVISEGTVKSHVKHILRKLRAANRAEAVSKYMRLSARAGQDPLSTD
jgi:DNA-binding CsgD family transcriptional regulator